MTGCALLHVIAEGVASSQSPRTPSIRRRSTPRISVAARFLLFAAVTRVALQERPEGQSRANASSGAVGSIVKTVVQRHTVFPASRASLSEIFVTSKALVDGTSSNNTTHCSPLGALSGHRGSTTCVGICPYCATVCWHLYLTKDIHSSVCKEWEDTLKRATVSGEEKYLTRFEGLTNILRTTAQEGPDPSEVASNIPNIESRVSGLEQFVSGAENSKKGLFTTGQWKSDANFGKGHHSTWDWPLRQVKWSIKVYQVNREALAYFAAPANRTDDKDAEMADKIASTIDQSAFYRGGGTWYGDINRGNEAAKVMIARLECRIQLRRAITRATKAPTPGSLQALRDAIACARTHAPHLDKELNGAQALQTKIEQDDSSPSGPSTPGTRPSGRPGTPGHVPTPSDPKLRGIIARAENALRTGKRMDNSIAELKKYHEEHPEKMTLQHLNLLAALEQFLQKDIHGRMDDAIKAGRDALKARGHPDDVIHELTVAMKILQDAIALAEQPLEGQSSVKYYMYIKDKWDQALQLVDDVEEKRDMLEIQKNLIRAIESAEEFLKTCEGNITVVRTLETVVASARRFGPKIRELRQGEKILELLTGLKAMGVEIGGLLTKAGEVFARAGEEKGVIGDRRKGLIHDLMDAKTRIKRGRYDKCLSEGYNTAGQWVRRFEEMQDCVRRLDVLTEEGKKVLRSRRSDGTREGQQIGDQLKQCDEYSHTHPQLFTEAREIWKKLVGLKNARDALVAAIANAEKVWKACDDENAVIRELDSAVRVAQAEYANELRLEISKASGRGGWSSKLEDRNGVRLTIDAALSAGQGAARDHTGECSAMKKMKDALKVIKDKGYEQCFKAQMDQLQAVIKSLWNSVRISIIVTELNQADRNAQDALSSGRGEKPAMQMLIPIVYYAKRHTSLDAKIASGYRSGMAKLWDLSRLSSKNSKQDRIDEAMRRGEEALSDRPSAGSADCALGELFMVMQGIQTNVNATLRSAVQDPTASQALELMLKLSNKAKATSIIKRLRDVTEQAKAAMHSNSEQQLENLLTVLYPAWLEARDHTKSTGERLDGYQEIQRYMGKVLQILLALKEKTWLNRC